MFSFSIRRLIGAAAVVGLAASAVVVGSVAVPAQTLALPGAAESSVVTIDPTRIADTRYDIGLTGKITAEMAAKFTVTGVIDTYIDSTSTKVPKQVVPDGATGVFLNVTVVAPGKPGFLAIRPGAASGVPATGGLNFDTGTVLANGVLVALPTTGDNAGQIDLYYGAITGASMHVIIDVVGYTTSSGLIDLAKRVEKLESPGVAAATISTGEQGEQGEQGPAGFTGATGAQGIQGEQGRVGPMGEAGDPAVDPARVLWVATSGDNTYPLLSDALAAISGPSDDEESVDDPAASGVATLPEATADNPYVIKIAPGTYEEMETVALRSFVDVEGSGQGVTTITCACGSYETDLAAATVSAFNVIHAEIRHLTIANTTGSVETTYSTGVATFEQGDSFSMSNVTATATGGNSMSGVTNVSSSPLMNNVTATAIGIGTISAGVVNSGSSPLMNNVTAIAIGVNSAGVYNQDGSSPTIRNSYLEGGTHGVYNAGSETKIQNSEITGDITLVSNSRALVATTLLRGAVTDVTNNSTLECFQVYDGNFKNKNCSFKTAS